MKIVLMSDLHLEFYRSMDPVDKMKEILTDIDYSDCIGAFVGDIHIRYQAPELLEQLQHRFKQIIFLPGNHDLWGANIADIGSHFLDRSNETFMIDDIQFTCAVGWAYQFQRFNPMQELLFKTSLFEHDRIKWREHAFTWENWLHLAQIDSDAIFAPKLPGARKKVVLTHYPPSDVMSDDRFLGNQANFLFASSYDGMLADGDGDIDMWLSGHTHHRTSATIGGTSLVSNPLGYPHEINDEAYQPIVLTVT
jgi:predicted phosphodiesterase